MDQFDRAQELDARFRDQALNLQHRVAAFDRETRKTCIDCGEEIPEVRRRVLPGCQRCIYCAEMLEREGGA